MSIFNFYLGLSPLWPDSEDIKTNCSYSFFLHLCQFSSVAQLCPTLCDPRDCSTPGFPVHHQLPEPTMSILCQTHVNCVGDAIRPSHPLSSPSPPAFKLPQHKGFFKWVSSSHQVAKVWKFQLQHQSFQWIFRTDFLYDRLSTTQMYYLRVLRVQTGVSSLTELKSRYLQFLFEALVSPCLF